MEQAAAAKSNDVLSVRRTLSKKVIAFVLAPFIVVFADGLLVIFTSTRDFATLLSEENQPFQLITFAVLLAASIIGFIVTWRLKPHGLRQLPLWFYLAFSVGLFMMAMEEISWGQWFFKFGTPEFIAAYNAQNETTVHNLILWGINIGGLSDLFFAVVSLGGLVGIWLGLEGQFVEIAPPAILASWFLLILFLAGADAFVDYFFVDSLFTKGIESLTEVYEMLFAVLAFSYIWLMAKKLPKGDAIERN